jgi:hypothetical protein
MSPSIRVAFNRLVLLVAAEQLAHADDSAEFESAEKLAS